MERDRATHWQDVYARKGENEVSWYQDRPDISLALLRETGFGKDRSIVDVGGGASRLVDALLEAGLSDICVLDVSAAALETARKRVGGASVDWVVADITAWQPARQYDFWHDRAAFHFLTDPDDRMAYVDVLARALPSGGIAIIGTFAPDGPETCSGLPVMRYDADAMARTLGERFALIGDTRHVHTTPWGAAQAFTFATFRRLPPAH